MFDSLRVFAPQIATLLEPGEQARFCAVVGYFPGDEQLGTGPDEGPDVLDVVFNAPSGRAVRRADRALTGRTLLGWPGCEAQELSTVVLRGTATQLLLTDRRVAVVDTAQWRLLWERPRSSIRRLAHRWRLGQAGRVMIQLDDGSALALVLGTLTARNARRLVRAWQQG